MAAPTFIAASTGATDAAGAWAATCHAPSAADRIIIFQVLVDGTTAGAPTISSTTNIKDLAGTSGQWTTVGTFNVGSATAATQQIYIGRSTSTSAPVITGANTGGDDLYWRFYEFSDVSTGTTLASVIENVTGGATVTSVGTSTTYSDASVTTAGPDRMALNFIAANDDVSIVMASGQTGGIWREVAGSYVDAGGTDGAIYVLNAYPAGIINVGTVTTNLTVFGGSGTFEKVAQSFLTAGSINVVSVTLHGIKNGTPVDNLIVEIQSDSAGSPSGVVLGTTSVAASSVPSGNVCIPVSASLSAATTYWIVLSRSGSRDITNYVGCIGGSNTYADGVGKKQDSGVWSAIVGGGDARFGVLADTDTGLVIDGGTASLSLSAAWGVTGFALIGTTVVSAAPGSSIQTRRQRRASRFLSFR